MHYISDASHFKLMYCSINKRHTVQFSLFTMRATKHKNDIVIIQQAASIKETHSHIHRRALSKLTSLLDLLAASLPSRCPLPLYTWWRISSPLKCLSLPADTQGHLPGFKQHLNATSTQSTSSNCTQIGSHSLSCTY